MHIRRQGSTGLRVTVPVLIPRVRRLMPFLAACCLATIGCAHHRADQYAYAPPYAPPVYPQPQQPQVHIPAQPTAYAAAGVPGSAVPTSAIPAGSLPPGAVVAGAPMASDGMVVQAVGGDCPPCSTDGAVMAGSTMPVSMIEGSGQTPPCPPGP
jgi:hypothetical protein